MPRRNGHWLRAFVKYASYTEAPNRTMFWTAIATVAGALRRRVWLDQKFFTWTPNFYIVLVAPPGIVSKSTTINVGLNLLRKVPGVNFGPDVVTWQALVEAMEEVSELVPLPGTKNFLPMAAITVGSDEFGTFLNPQDRDMMDVMVSLWDGKRGTFLKRTKHSGSNAIENPWINVIGCTTPSWISQNFPEYMIGGGFTSRCVFIYADKKRQLVPYPGLTVPLTFDKMRTDLIADLEHIATALIGEYVLTDDAVRWGVAWYHHHWTSPAGHLAGEEYAGYLSRKQTHIHKLAMILAAAQRDRLMIEEADLIEAEQLLSAIELEMPRVFRSIGQTAITRLAAGIVAVVNAQAGAMVSSESVYSSVFRLASHEDYQKALESAIAGGFVRTVLGQDQKIWLTKR